MWKFVPDDELVVVRVELGTPHPVAVPRQHLGGLTELASVPEFHLAVAPGSNQHHLLVRVVVNTPVIIGHNVIMFISSF